MELSYTFAIGPNAFKARFLSELCVLHYGRRPRGTTFSQNLPLFGQKSLFQMY